MSNIIIKYQKKEIKKLKNQVADLMQQNEYLKNQVDNNKNTILSKQEYLDKKEQHLTEMETQYKLLIDDLIVLKSNYNKALKERLTIQNKMEKELKKTMQKFQKGKS